MTEAKYPVTFPPYGGLIVGDTKILDDGPEVPPDLSVGENCDSACRREFWEHWRKETEDIIARVLWPRFDSEKPGWEDSPAVATMEDLTRADLELIVYLRTHPAGGQLAAKPKSPLISPDCPTQGVFFKAEDLGTNWFDRFKFYDTTFDPAQAKAYNDILTAGVLGKVATTHYQFKLRFQRPRAYQTAVLLQVPNFSHNLAITAMTPSLCSGHALQDLYGVGAVMESLAVHKTKVSPESWTALERFAVDIGDRRVFAGVHYPSDNIASWIIGMRLAAKVFRLPETRHRLWSAISHSDVYNIVSTSPLHRPALEELHKLKP